MLNVVLLAASADVQSACSKATEFQPQLCTVKLPAISQVWIVENGARASATAEPSLDCARFKLDNNQVRRYFGRAQKIQQPEDSHHTLDWLPCYASGTIEFANGKKATWVIEQSQTARLAVAGEPELSFYCPRCKFKPFLW